MKKMFSIFIVTIIMMTLSITSFAADDTETNVSVIEDKVVKDDLRIRERADKDKLLKGVDFGTVEMNQTNPQVELPEGLLIRSVIGTPYGIERASGEVFYFPNYQIGVNVIYQPSNNMIVKYTAEQTDKFIADLSAAGYDLYAWRVVMEYEPNTVQLPRRLSIFDSRGEEMDYVDLKSSSQRRKYGLDFLIANVFPGDEYETVIRGEMIATNLDGSAKSFPFSAGFQFTASIQ